MTTQFIQNIFEHRHQLQTEGVETTQRPVNCNQGFLVRMIRKLQNALTNSLQQQLKVNDERKAVEHLNAMTDDQLSDLGITRPDIPVVVQYGKEAL